MENTGLPSLRGEGDDLVGFAISPGIGHGRGTLLPDDEVLQRLTCLSQEPQNLLTVFIPMYEVDGAALRRQGVDFGADFLKPLPILLGGQLVLKEGVMLALIKWGPRKAKANSDPNPCCINVDLSSNSEQ
jgi:hypothetical protein